MMNKYLERLQEIHENADTDTHKVMLRLFDEKPAERDAAVQEFGMSLPDLAQIPKRTPDEKIIKLIASEMSKNKEKEMKPHEWEKYLNSYLTSRKEEDGITEKVALTQTAIKYFNKVLNAKINSYKYHTGNHLPEEYLNIHPTNTKGELDLTGTDQIIKFIRKEFIQEAYKNGKINTLQKVDFIKFSCDLLIKMYAYEDERQSHDILEESRKIFNNYTTNELTKDFRHKAKDEEKPMIRDKSDRNYFSDKRYRIGANTLKQKGILVDKDILFNIEARAKDSLSIERKGQFDPDINSAKALSDIGGIRSIGKTEDELNILLTYQLMKNNENTMKYNKEFLDKFPYGADKQEKTGKQYTQNEIEEIVKYMVRIKDKDVIKTVLIKEANEFGPNQYDLDEAFFEKHGIKDIFVLQQLRNVVKKKNETLQKIFDEAKKDKDEAKKETLKSVIQSTHPGFNTFIEDEESLEILYWVIKKIKTIEAKRSQLDKIQEVVDKAKTDKKIKIYSHDKTGLTYKENINNKNSKQKTIQIQPSTIEIKGKKKEAYYTIENGSYVVLIDDHVIQVGEANSLSHSFLQDRKEKEDSLKKQKNRSGRKIGASDRKEAKIEGDMYTKTGDFFSGEHQFVTEETMANMKPTTVAEVYDNMKAVFEQARCFNVITHKDIQSIIHNRLVPMLQNTPKTQNGRTGNELIELLSKPTSGTSEANILEEKILNELTERGLRILTINGEEQEGYYIKPSFVKRLKKNGLRVD